MTYFYYNINKIDKDIFANLYIKIIEDLTTIFNIIPYNKITGPPDEFPYFNKVIYYIYNIIQLFDGNNIFFDSILNNNSKNNNYIINTLESIITDDFSKSTSKNFIIKCCKLSDIIEEIYTICNFFQFKIIYLNPTCSKANNYEKIEHNDSTLFIQMNCVSNINFLQFVLNNGYSKYEYWSDKGLLWLKNYPKKMPFFWKNFNNIWYIKKFDRYIKLFDISSSSIQNISYYEAEAYCKYKKIKLLELKHYKIISSKQLHQKFNLCNVCEWIRSNHFTKANCFGGSQHNYLIINNINDIKTINKSAQHYFTGFRTIKS
jgi:hypothetical protein